MSNKIDVCLHHLHFVSINIEQAEIVINKYSMLLRSIEHILIRHWKLEAKIDLLCYLHGAIAISDKFSLNRFIFVFGLFLCNS